MEQGRILRKLSRKRLKQVSDEGELGEICERIVKENPDSIADFKNGKDRAFGFGWEVMAETKGQANPKNGK